MKQLILAFLCQDKGAVTAEWIVLCALLIGMGMVVLGPVAFSTESSTQGVADYIGGLRVGYGTD